MNQDVFIHASFDSWLLRVLQNHTWRYTCVCVCVCVYIYTHTHTHLATDGGVNNEGWEVRLRVFNPGSITMELYVFRQVSLIIHNY